MTDRIRQSSVVHVLNQLPVGGLLNGVRAESVIASGRQALRVELTSAAALGVPGVDYIDQPTFVQIPADFETAPSKPMC